MLSDKFPPTTFANLLEAGKRLLYRVRKDQKKLVCPHPDYPNAFVVLPREWLGRHAILKDEAIVKTTKFNSVDITNLSVCLAIVDDFGNIPGLDKVSDPESWDFNKVPIPILSWIIDTVLGDMQAAYHVPKASSQQ
jgi:hypothetical protein